MSTYTDDDIARLIACQKAIKDAPRREMKEENRHRRNDMTVVSSSNEAFDVFIRQSMEFSEDFSVGLVYCAPDGKRVTLVRFNGQHEQTSAPFSDNPHFNYHIHRATPENLNNGRHEKHPASITDTYASLDEAIAEFMATTKIEGWQKHFPNSVQLSLIQQREE